MPDLRVIVALPFAFAQELHSTFFERPVRRFAQHRLTPVIGFQTVMIFLRGFPVLSPSRASNSFSARRVEVNVPDAGFLIFTDWHSFTPPTRTDSRVRLLLGADSSASFDGQTRQTR